ncbi:ABC transporter ATP-binding protein [Rhodococcus triatomae]|uniref:Sulfonate transport system ATP-binding protein n=1 Tax=Rhodococcus triatomae TaxID=300028 RepID=A0A1G8EV12_9NOCA|nr:ABC transporter ATP-binding protein [Rhodococcus triatomae]QNG19301.1 ABC transporter ATP-binding protein [Rhodococcus triatomae]QNG24786.1 ABC transporter ATP-binding protein [Rhodococcus triatomae]SDH73695.1 sulfonate transport system ATP-binding protein [Rhodococcus triatomae]
MTDTVPRTGTPAARLAGLRKSFGPRVVLDGIDLDIAHGEIVALVGRSGSGKSTLLRVLAGLSDDHTGTAHVAGHPTVVFQEPRLIPWLPVVKNVALGLKDRRSRARGEAQARTVLGDVGLGHRADAWPLTLSGGEAQRAALARALVAEPTLLLLDEPFGALDALTRLAAHDLLLRLFARHGFGVLLVTHDVAEAVTLADRVLVLDSGRIAHEVPIDLPRPRKHASPDAAVYAARLLSLLGVDDQPSPTQKAAQ